MIDPLCSLQIKLTQKLARLHVSTLDSDAGDGFSSESQG